MKILLFGGTAEGHALAHALAQAGHSVICCVATDYGRDVLAPAENLTVRAGRMDEAQMVSALQTGYDCVIDATHPYAAQVSENIRAAAKKASVPYDRLIRPREQAEHVLWADSPEDAAHMLEDIPGNILLTTGSKDLAAFAALSDFAERVWARMLPSMDSLSYALSLGFPASHIICMQGPFSQELNVAMLRQIGAKILVSKDTGRAGGFAEKAEAAKQAGATLLVIRRPTVETGLTLDEMLKKYTGGRP